MMGSLLMALLLLLPVLAPTVHARAGDLCNRTTLTQPRPIDLEKIQGRWYYASHTYSMSRQEIHYIILDVTSSNRIVKLTYTYIWGDQQGQCSPPATQEMTMSEDSQNHFVMNDTKHSSSIHLYFTEMDICYSTAILYTKNTDMATNAFIADFIGLLVRNPHAVPNPAKFCPGEDFKYWKHPSNNRMCNCN